MTEFNYMELRVLILATIAVCIMVALWGWSDVQMRSHKRDRDSFDE